MAVKDVPFSAAGTTLGFKLLAATAEYTPIGEIIDLDWGGATIAKIVTSKLSSTVHTSIPGIPDNGDVTFNCHYIPGNAAVAQLQALSQAPAVIFWQIQLPDGSSGTTGSALTFSAWLNSFSVSGLAIDDKPLCAVGITITSAMTPVAGS